MLSMAWIIIMAAARFSQLSKADAAPDVGIHFVRILREQGINISLWSPLAALEPNTFRAFTSRCRRRCGNFNHYAVSQYNSDCQTGAKRIKMGTTAP
ncbi:hypothetical protein INT80_12305 [Gallibacterium anatis]|uniref:Uncharacterized protein n=1 Tax=Gallibacterium anatis TaxID=750 RepID=A0A930UYA3_9PAST|nr:hypothetical protein [Gallibacterium anatis]